MIIGDMFLRQLLARRHHDSEDNPIKWLQLVIGAGRMTVDPIL
jgi:hypothetical protein